RISTFGAILFGRNGGISRVFSARSLRHRRWFRIRPSVIRRTLARAPTCCMKSFMNFRNMCHLFAIVALTWFAAGCGNDTSSPSVSAQSQPEPRNAEAVVTGMRLRTLSKSLGLTDEQKPKVQALFEEENK